MKTNVFLLFAIIFFTSCNSTKSKQKEIPFVVQNATYQDWFGGQEGVKGVKIKIVIKSNSKQNNYQTLYYLDKKGKIKSSFNDNNIGVLTVNINTSSLKQDRIISKNKEDEFGNQVPIKPKYLNLKKSEAVIEYLQDGILKYYKVSLTEKEALYYP